MDKRILLPLVILPAFQTGNMQAAEQPAKRPNIILFMVDDMGWEDTSLPFWTEKTHYNEVYETPNMERLARQGVMFTQAYASSISSPSRCSLITGTNAARHRVTNWTLQKDKTTDRKDSLLDIPDWNYNGVSQVPGTNNTFVGTSFVQLLKNSGYHTIHCGKAHFGAIDTPGEDPHHWGFEVNIAGHAAGGLASYLGEENYGHTKDGKPTSLMSIPGLEKYWGTEMFATEALTLEAIKALDKAKKYNQPFYLYMSHYAIHIPLNKDMRFYEKYKKKGPLYTQNYPLLSGKGSLCEGGIREPMIVSWPGVAQPNTRCDKYLLIEDFYPTILEMAGVKDYETVQPIDGISFVPLLTGTGDPSKGRSLFWNMPNNWGNDGPGINFNCAVRNGDWKLIYYYGTGKKELFNISDDIGEKNDLSTRHPEIIKRLSKELGDHLRKVDAQRPSFKATGKACPWPDEIN